jgi:quinol-cytochrome oxidoreductase complex cytochrome b subunit
VDAAADQEASGPGLRTARKIFLVLLASEFVVLAATGLFLVFQYRPEASQSWNALGLGPSGVHLWAIARVVHRTTSALFIATALGAVVVVALAYWTSRTPEEPRHGRRLDLLVIGLLPLALFASFTGYLLPWDQLALWAVTVGTNMSGYRPVFGHEVKFVLMGGVEVSRETLLRWFYTHLLVGGPLIALFIVAVWWPLRRAAEHRATTGADLTVRQ